MDEMIGSGRVAVSPYARDLIAPVVLFQRVQVPRTPLCVPLEIPAMPFNEFVKGSLHPKIREQYGFTWTRAHQIVYEKAAEKSREYYPKVAARTPNVVRFTPSYVRAHRELAQAA